MSLVLISLVLAGCHRDVSVIREKAEWLCRYGEAADPGALELLPKGQDPAKYIRAADLAFVHKKARDTEKDASAFAGLLRAFKAGVKPAARALAQARAERTECKVGKVELKGTEAHATVHVRAPELGDDVGLDVVGKIGSLDSEAKRLAKARELFKGAKLGTPQTAEIQFVKQGKEWVANLGLPEKAKAAAARKQEADCVATNLADTETAVNKGLFDLASESMAKLAKCRNQFLKAGGDTAGLPPGLAGEIARLSVHIAHKTVPIKWKYEDKVNPMDDTATTFLSLDAEDELDGPITKFRPSLMLRCHKGRPEAFFTTGGPTESIYGDFDRTRVRERFDEAKPIRVRASQATSHDALFLPAPKKLIQKLEGTKRLLLGWSPFGSGEVVATFDVHGLNQNLDGFWKRCGATSAKGKRTGGH